MKKSALRFAAVAALVVGFAVTAAAQTKTVLTTVKKSVYTDSVKTASSVAMTASQPYSFTAFFKIDSSLLWGGGNIAKIIGDGATMLGVYTVDGVAKMVFKCHSNQYNYNTLTLCDAPTDGAWHHAAVTVASANSCIFYLDGEAVYTGTANIGYKESSPVTLFVNSDKSWTSGGFGGSLAEVSMWNRVLSAEEVLAMKAGRPDSTVLSNGCLGFWTMEDEPDQTTAADLLGVRDLTISSTAVFNFTTTDDFPEYEIGDATVYVPINRLYPTNRVTVTIGEGASMKNDMFEKDKEVTFTATAGEESGRFVRWYGDVPEDQACNPTITIVADQEKTIVPYFAFDWLYDKTAKTIDDGYWMIHIPTTSGGATNLKLGMPIASHSLPLVDLTKPIADAESAAYSLVGVYMYGSGEYAFMGNSVIRELRLPTTMTSIDASLNVNWDKGAFMNCVNLKKVTPFMGDYLTSVGEHVFYGCTSLEGELVLGGGASECVLLGRRESTRDNGHHFASTKITGVTAKANIHDLPYAVFSGCSVLSNVVFEAGSITNIAASAFANCKKVTDFAMPERPEGIADNAFSGWTARQCRFVIHASEPRWAAYLADSANFTPWSALDAATKAAYRAKFGRGRRPMGLSLTLPANQWLVSDQAPGLTVLVR